MDTAEPVVVASVWMENEASIIRSLLESYGIPCHYTAEIASRVYPLSVEGRAQIRIFVSASLADEARDILEQHLNSEAGAETGE
jgi:hypothetical protein